jgi:Flp pilus assembly pilin Flp
MEFFRTQNSGSTAIIYGLLLVLLALWIGGAVSHYCIDGLEPPVTVHFDNLNGHVEHDLMSGHNDFEKSALPENLLSKFLEVGVQLFLVILFIISMPFVKARKINLLELVQKYSCPQVLLPPLRAPPIYS